MRSSCIISQLLCHLQSFQTGIIAREKRNGSWVCRSQTKFSQCRWWFNSRKVTQWKNWSWTFKFSECQSSTPFFHERTSSSHHDRCYHHQFHSIVLLICNQSSYPHKQALEAQTQRMTQELARLQTTNSEVQGTSKTVCASFCVWRRKKKVWRCVRERWNFTHLKFQNSTITWLSSCSDVACYTITFTCIVHVHIRVLCMSIHVECTATQISEERAMLLQQVTELKTQNEKYTPYISLYHIWMTSLNPDFANTVSPTLNKQVNIGFNPPWYWGQAHHVWFRKPQNWRWAQLRWLHKRQRLWADEYDWFHIGIFLVVALKNVFCLSCVHFQVQNNLWSVKAKQGLKLLERFSSFSSSASF